ncbi:hypothetical protein [Rhizobium sp. C4]|uniref:hypothetical protein n=1 Tax=Rhizobium sp. C4 TaxID=1349800 RepID=UPI001E31DE1A|nr:hypothetical protein [Rhizobium sp. C4]MCD2171803.1 hypothetical protein [Rhizobium sp. C4]
MRHFNLTRVLFAGTAAALISSHAYALDGEEMLKKLNAAYASYGSQFTYDSVKTDDTTVVAKGVKLKVEGADKPTELPIGDVTFSDVEEADDGGYYAGNVAFQNVDLSKDGGHVTAKDIQIDGLSIPGTPSTDSIDGMILYESAHTGPITVEQDGKRVFQIEKTVTNINVAEDSSGIGFDTSISGIWADLSDVKDPKGQETINKLGLTNINGNMVTKGSWTSATGKIDITELSIDARDVGKINLLLSMSGYTPQLMKAMQDATKAAASNPDKKAGEAALGMTMMGLLQQLSFNSASIRFDDASITKRLLDYFGKEQGVTGEQFAQSLKGMVPIMIAQLNVPDLQNQVSAAVAKFLDDPKSLEIKAAPASPVAAPMIMGAAMGAPQTLPQVLGVSVNANQ